MVVAAYYHAGNRLLPRWQPLTTTLATAYYHAGNTLDAVAAPLLCPRNWCACAALVELRPLWSCCADPSSMTLNCRNLPSRTLLVHARRSCLRIQVLCLKIGSMFKAALRPGLECLRSMLKGGAGSNVTLNLGQFPEMRFYPHISFSEIDLQLNATFDSTPPFRDFNKAQNKKSGLRRIQSY